MDNIWQSQLQPFSFFVQNFKEDPYDVDDPEYAGFPDIFGDLTDLVEGIDYQNDEQEKVKIAVNEYEPNLSYVCGSERNKEKLELKEGFETGCSSRKEYVYKSLSIDIPELQLPEDPWDGPCSPMTSSPNGGVSTLDSDSPANCDLDTLDMYGVHFMVDNDMDDNPPFTQPLSKCICKRKGGASCIHSKMMENSQSLLHERSLEECTFEKCYYLEGPD